jgi:hypothetical protein
MRSRCKSPPFERAPKFMHPTGSDLVSSGGQNLRGCFEIALVDQHPRATRQIKRVGAAGIVCCHPCCNPHGGEQPLNCLCLNPRRKRAYRDLLGHSTRIRPNPIPHELSCPQVCAVASVVLRGAGRAPSPAGAAGFCQFQDRAGRFETSPVRSITSLQPSRHAFMPCGAQTLLSCDRVQATFWM